MLWTVWIYLINLTTSAIGIYNETSHYKINQNRSRQISLWSTNNGMCAFLLLSSRRPRYCAADPMNNLCSVGWIVNCHALPRPPPIQHVCLTPSSWNVGFALDWFYGSSSFTGLIRVCLMSHDFKYDVIPESITGNGQFGTKCQNYLASRCLNLR